VAHGARVGARGLRSGRTSTDSDREGEDEVDLSAGRFWLKGEVLAYEELDGDERRAVVTTASRIGK
jgi:hypothetical protein